MHWGIRYSSIHPFTHPFRGRHLAQHLPSQQNHPSTQLQAATGLWCPRHAGGAEEGRQEGGSGSLGTGTSPLAGRRQTSPAGGREKAALAGRRCHQHIKWPAELLSHRGAQSCQTGTGGDTHTTRTRQFHQLHSPGSHHGQC